MTWINIFDLVRHIFEFFFYLITGPLVTFFAVKKLTQKKDTKTQILELQRKIYELERVNTTANGGNLLTANEDINK